MESNIYESISFYLNIIFLLFIIILIIINRNYEKQIDFFDLIKIYEIGEKDSIISEINIRKEDGQSCKIITEFPDSSKIDEYNNIKNNLNENDINYESRLKNLGKVPLFKNVSKKGDCL